MNRLCEKTTIVTGAAQGMGGAPARHFGVKGVRVVPTDINFGDGEKVIRELGVFLGTKAVLSSEIAG